jgi:hypothetical protein
MPEDRLVCLAQTLGNIEFYGCQYPEETMKEVKMLILDAAGLDHCS